MRAQLYTVPVLSCVLRSPPPGAEPRPSLDFSAVALTSQWRLHLPCADFRRLPLCGLVMLNALPEQAVPHAKLEYVRCSRAKCPAVFLSSDRRKEMMSLSCPHFAISIRKRSKRQSAMAGAAYQSGEKLFSEYDCKTKNYRYKAPEVVCTEILLPSNAPREYQDRQTLWNAAEGIEKQWNSQLSRGIIMALPNEIPQEQYAELVRGYCMEQFVAKGMCVDFAVHDKDDGNPHAHIMLTMRSMDDQGHWNPKAHKVYDLDENGERIELDLPKPSGRAAQILKERTETARKLTANKYFKYDEEDVPSFNIREILLDAPRSRLTEIAKEYKIKGHTKMTQWGLAAAIAKLPNIAEIVMDLIVRHRHYEIAEEDIKYLQSLRFQSRG